MVIAQLSDPHIRPAGYLYKGLVDSNALFSAAVRHLNALSPAPDVVLLSGDVTEDGTPAAYEMALALLSDIKQPLIVIPGNHDDRETFRAHFVGMEYLPTSGPLHCCLSSLGPIRIVGLDVTVPGEHHGALDDDVIDWLDRALAQEPDRPTLIMMHQPPFRSGIPYLDAYRCFGEERLKKLLSRYPMVESIVCGHVHRFMQRRFAGTVVCTAPSTATSIALRLADDAKPASFIEPPAFLLHRWTQDDGLVTHLVPIGSFPGPFDFF